jgi:hypothetical protein
MFRRRCKDAVYQQQKKKKERYIDTDAHHLAPIPKRPAEWTSRKRETEVTWCIAEARKTLPRDSAHRRHYHLSLFHFIPLVFLDFWWSRYVSQIRSSTFGETHPQTYIKAFNVDHGCIPCGK